MLKRADTGFFSIGRHTLPWVLKLTIHGRCPDYIKYLLNHWCRMFTCAAYHATVTGCLKADPQQEGISKCGYGRYYTAYYRNQTQGGTNDRKSCPNSF